MNKSRLIISGLSLLAIIAAYTQELPVMMNYLEVGAFWKTGLVTGALLGVGCLIAIYFTKKYLPKDTVARMQLAASILFACLLLCPLLLSWTNRLGVPSGQERQEEVIFESEQARFTSRFGSTSEQKQEANQFILFFFHEGQLYRVNSDHSVFPQATTGDTIQLNLKTGRLGYRWVEL